MAVYFGAKYGHDFHQISAELFHVRFFRCIVEDGDFDATKLACLEDDFASKSEQAVFVG